MVSRRNSLGIIADILRIAKGGAKKTQIVYSANLNFKLLREYVEKLEEAGLVEVENRTRGQIRTTRKGIEYLNSFEDLMTLVNSMQSEYIAPIESNASESIQNV